MTYSRSSTESFSLTHARRLAGKVSADLHQCRRFYGLPSEGDIADYNAELAVMLAGEYVDSYEFGFEVTRRRVVSWYYTVSPAGDLGGGRSGGLYALAAIEDASWFNVMGCTTKWWSLTAEAQGAVQAQHNIHRVNAEPPSDGLGRWIRDRTYVSGGVAVVRQEFRPW